MYNTNNLKDIVHKITNNIFKSMFLICIVVSNSSKMMWLYLKNSINMRLCNEY